MDSDARVVRGINIATVILSGLHILFALFLIIMLGLSSSMMTDPDFVEDVMHEMQSGGSSAFDDDIYYYDYDYDYSNMSSSEAQALVSTGITAVIVMGVGYLVCKIIALVAGILALRNNTNPARYGSMFGFAIAAIVVSVLTGAFISGALFVVSAVYISRMRRNYRFAQQGYGQPPYGYAQPGQPPVQPGQPPYGAGQQPGAWGQGQAPYQVPQNQVPQQPVAPQPPQDQQVSPAPAAQPMPQTPELHQPATEQPAQQETQEPAAIQQPSSEGAEQSNNSTQDASHTDRSSEK